MAEIIKDPELRYTQEGQMAIAEMMVQFAGLRAEDPASSLKVIGWGTLAQQIQEQFHTGDKVVIEGRLTMTTVDRPEGFKEKQASMTASRVHLLGAEGTMTSTVAVASPEATPAKAAAPAAAPKSTPAVSKPAATPAPQPAAAADLPNYDDIPF
jgi:single-stranded DNA-binding protein